MGPEMEVNLQQLNNSGSTQLAGAAVGCIFFVPFAVKYGRRPVYLLSIGLMAAVSWWTSRMNTYAELLITNLLTGIFCSVNETTVQMTISDLFFVHQRGTANGVYFVMVMVGSFLTPMIAGSQAAVQGWRWSYYAFSISLTILFVVFLLSYEETKYVPIHQGQAMVPTAEGEEPSHHKGADSIVNGADDAVTKDPGFDSVIKTSTNCAPHGPPATNSYWQRMRLVTPTSDSLLRVFVAPFRIIFFPHVLFTALQFASGVCWLVLLLNGTSIVFSAPPYNFSTAGVGYMALGPFVGNLFGALYGGPLSDWSITYFAKRRNGGVFEPEMRLYILLPPCLFMSGGLAMFGATAGMGMHWIYPSIGGAFFAFGLGATGDIAFTFVIDTYRDVSHSAAFSSPCPTITIVPELLHADLSLFVARC
jgi:MFS family permease